MPACAGIWPILVAIYGIHGLGIQYSVQDYVVLGVMGLFVSIGVAGVPGTATIVTASVLTAVGLPLEIMVLTIPISSIADMGRTATNVTAAAVASTIVARQENDLDEDILYGRKSYIPPEDKEESGTVYVAASYTGVDGTAALDGGDDEFDIPTGGACKI
jgi:Na+/H+-dicarboxylate symporter